jgi:hypothetical protein
MARVVESVAPDFGDVLHVEKVVTKQLEGAMRYNEMSRKLGRPAPVPSIFIDGELIFDQTPSQQELRDRINGFLAKGDNEGAT